MLEIEFICPGKTKEIWLQTALDEYLKRLKPYTKTSFRIFKESSSTNRKISGKAESEKISEKLNPHSFFVLLDHTGDLYSSEQFALFFEKNLNRGIAKYQFVIGGAYGVNDTIKKKAKKILAFSPMTFTHQMIRLIALEQIYRAVSIINGTGYHH